MMPSPSRPHPRCRAAALDYLARGWSVVVCCSADHSLMPESHQRNCTRPGKRPLWEGWQQKRVNEDHIRLYFNRHPTANVGIVLGTASGLFGIDIDGDEGEDLLRAVSGSDLPDTLEFTTPGGGRRLLYALEELVLSIRVDQHQRREVIRWMGDGSQTIMPPSLHAEGGEYEWIDGHRPGELAPARVPEWLVRRMREPMVPPAPKTISLPPPSTVGLPGGVDLVERARRYLSTMGVCDPRPDHPMDASTHLLIAASALVIGFGLDDGTALSLLAEWDSGNPLAPYPERELERKISEARKTNNRPAGYLLSESSNGVHSSPPLAIPPIPAKAKAPPAPTILSATDLMAAVYPEPRWAVPGLIPEGATICAGRPKSGKSWLTLNLALAVASGGVALGRHRVERGDVLYLALEDGPRRLQKRLRTILKGQPDTSVPVGLNFATEWPTLDQGGLTALSSWLESHPDARLVAVDTLARIRGKRSGRDGALYDEDYAVLGSLQTLTMRHGIALVIIHHTRKGDAEDPFDLISGTTGVSGPVDTLAVLVRRRQERTATLHLTGRDVDEQELSLSWDPEHCLWSLTEAEPDGMTADQRAIVLTLQEAGPLPPLEIAPRIGKSYDSTKKLLQRMYEDEKIQRRGGLYSVTAPEVSPDVPASL